MAYIGKEPTVGNFQVCDAISVVNGQAAYTMQVGGVNASPETANHMLVSLNGILQAPTSSYTVAGATITFASNLVTGDVINFIQILGNVLDLGVPSDATVSTAKIVDANVTLAKLSATGTKNSTTFLRGDNTFNAPPNTGITEADQFRLTASLTSDVDPISSNLERVDSDGFGKIGTGMSLSSGIYTFPSTGTYLIILTLQGYVVSSDNIVLSLFTTTDNSSYNTAARVVLSGTNSENLGSNFFYFNVSNTSTHKAKFVAQSIASGSSFSGSTDKNGTCFSFIRLGDST